MVSQNQMSSDFYDYSYTTLQDNDDDELTIAFLMTLLSFYDKYMSKSPNYILSHIDKDIKKLQSNLLSDLKKYEIKSIIDKIREKLDYYDEFDYDVTQTRDVTESTINAIIQQLHYDIITKALVWLDQNNEIEEFDIKANYQRAVKRLRDTASYYNGMVRQKIERNILEKIQSIEVKSGNGSKTRSKVEHLDEVDLAQMSLFDTVTDEDVLEEIKSLDVSSMTPLDALNTLYKLQNKLINRYSFD